MCRDSSSHMISQHGALTTLACHGRTTISLSPSPSESATLWRAPAEETLDKRGGKHFYLLSSGKIHQFESTRNDFTPPSPDEKCLSSKPKPDKPKTAPQVTISKPTKLLPGLVSAFFEWPLLKLADLTSNILRNHVQLFPSLLGLPFVSALVDQVDYSMPGPAPLPRNMNFFKYGQSDQVDCSEDDLILSPATLTKTPSSEHLCDEWGHFADFEDDPHCGLYTEGLH